MFAIGDKEWNGLSKLLEESGEVIQVGGKVMGSHGVSNHWSGDLREKFIEELGDLMAAILYFSEKNFTDEELERIGERAEQKFLLFEEWNKDEPPLPEVEN